jgi:ATP synthase protein I
MAAKEPDRPKALFNYGRYSGMAFQMLAIILLGVFGGVKLDKCLGLSFPVFTLILSILSVGLAIYQAIRELLKITSSKSNYKKDVTK